MQTGMAREGTEEEKENDKEKGRPKLRGNEEQEKENEKGVSYKLSEGDELINRIIPLCLDSRYLKHQDYTVAR